MDDKELLKFCLEKGFLLDREILNLFKEISDTESVKLILEKVKTHTRQRVITKKVFSENKNKVREFFLELPEKNQEKLRKLKIRLGLSIEISQEVAQEEAKIISQQQTKEDFNEGVKVLSNFSFLNKKPEVGDFIKYFRNRFLNMKGFLQQHSELEGLVSINKISGSRQNFSIIGLVSDKKITKNKNLLFEIEDLTGKIRVLVNANREEVYKKAEEISLDSVVGFRGSGNREIFFANDVVFPELRVTEKKRSLVDESVVFLGDLHFGSKLFLKEGFLKFIDYLNGKVPNTPEASKIKYVFFVGDLITGIGNYPNQEKDLKIKNLEDQFIELAELLGKIRKDMILIISPGNHDCVRLMEPQPILDEKYAWPLYDMENVILTPNPCEVNIGAKKGFSGFNVLTYHGFSFPFYADTVPSLIAKKAMNVPDDIMKYLLKNRHLAPTHASVQYFPHEEDALLIRNVPDIFVSGHTHKSAISYYNNILTISVSSWEGKTPYQEKFGNEPDHCKVPMFNLKTGAVKILDFE